MSITIEKIKIAKMPINFCGHSPNSHCVINKKLRITHAKLNVVIARFAYLAQTVGIKKRPIAIIENIICRAPGLPKLVWAACTPEIVVLIDSI